MPGQELDQLVKPLKKPCVCCRGQIFSQILLKLGQNVCLIKILLKFLLFNVIPHNLEAQVTAGPSWPSCYALAVVIVAIRETACNF